MRILISGCILMLSLISSKPSIAKDISFNIAGTLERPSSDPVFGDRNRAALAEGGDFKLYYEARNPLCSSNVFYRNVRHHGRFDPLNPEHWASIFDWEKKRKIFSFPLSVSQSGNFLVYTGSFDFEISRFCKYELTSASIHLKPFYFFSENAQRLVYREAKVLILDKESLEASGEARFSGFDDENVTAGPIELEEI